MKKLLLIIFLLGSLLSKAQIQKAELVATGLTCSMCSNSIFKKLTAIKGVDSVQIDLNKNLFTIHFAKANDINPNAIRKAVEDAGFFVGSLEIELPKHNVSEENKNEIYTPFANYIVINNLSNTNKRTIKLKLMDKGFLTTKQYKKLIGKKRFVVNTKDGKEMYHVNAI